MKKTNFTSLLTPAVLVLSVAGFCLRMALYNTAVDEKGLLVSGHPLEIGLWTLMLAGAALIVLAVRKLDGSNEYEDNFRRSVPSSYLLLAVVIALMVLRNDFLGSDRLALIQRVLGAVTVPGLLWGGVCRYRGKKPFFLFHVGLCLFLLLHTVSRYQSWSGNPQLQDYVFELLAAVALILFSYHCAAFEAGLGNRRMQLATGLLAVLLCGAAASCGDAPRLYAAGFLWAGTDLCCIDPPLKKEEVESHDPS